MFYIGVVETLDKHGEPFQSWDTWPFDSADAAREVVLINTSRLTDWERKRTRASVQGWEINPAAEGYESFSDWYDDWIGTKPDYYEAVPCD